MEHPAWLKEEADRGCAFWRRNYEVAIELDDACMDALLATLERQFAEGETEHRPPKRRNRFSLADG
jgi:hypothetical protein